MWHEIFAGVYFCGLGIFSVSRKLIFATRCTSVIVRWHDFIPSKLSYFKLVSLVCQILLIAGLNIRTIKLN